MLTVVGVPLLLRNESATPIGKELRNAILQSYRFGRGGRAWLLVDQAYRDSETQQLAGARKSCGTRTNNENLRTLEQVHF
jgi:hypothetical protein